MCGIDYLIPGHCFNFFKHTVLRGLVLGQQPERPRKRDGGCFMARGDKGEQVGYDLIVAHASSGLVVTRGEQQVEKIGF